MALINCPECGKQFSEYANACPNCGIPRNRIENIVKQETKYDVILQYITPKYSGVCSQYLENYMKCSNYSAFRLLINLPSYLLNDVSYDVAKNLCEELKQFECQTKIVEHTDGIESNNNLIKNKSTDVHCPRCGSTSISTTARGFSIWTGFLGSSKTVNRCAKCGNTWKPR